MSLERKKIRDYIVSTLKGKTDARDRVFSSRTVANWTNNLPAINVYTTDEDINELNQAPRILKRMMTVRFEIAVSCSEEGKAADDLDRIMQQLEDVLEVDFRLGKRCDDLMLKRIAVEFDPGGEKPIGAAQMDWDCLYTTDAPGTRAGQNADKNFKGANIEWQTEGNNSVPEATDTLNIPAP